MTRYVLMYRKFAEDATKRNKFLGQNGISHPVPLGEALFCTRDLAFDMQKSYQHNPTTNLTIRGWHREYGDNPLVVCKVRIDITMIGVGEP